MLKTLGLLFAAAGVVYFLFYPFLKNKVSRKKTFKWFVIIYTITVFGSTAGTYLARSRQPDSFRKGVEMVKRNKEISSQIGEFRSVKYNKEDLPEETDNPADLKFRLEGSRGSIQVEGRVAKNKDGGWYLVQLKKDSFVEKF